MPIISAEDRENAEDIGALVCDQCGVIYMPLPWYENDGHQCGTDGTQDKYLIDP